MSSDRRLSLHLVLLAYRRNETEAGLLTRFCWETGSREVDERCDKQPPHQMQYRHQTHVNIHLRGQSRLRRCLWRPRSCHRTTSASSQKHYVHQSDKVIESARHDTISPVHISREVHAYNCEYSSRRERTWRSLTHRSNGVYYVT